MGSMIKVGMADLKACKCPDSLTTLGLGSCVGVALYDPVTKVSGLLHCMLPDSRLVAKIAGGAQMFANRTNSEALRVGERNVIAVKQKLKSLNIRILSQDCGENFGRTVEFYSETGDYVIKAVGKPQKAI